VGFPHHVIQRGNNREDVFFDAAEESPQRDRRLITGNTEMLANSFLNRLKPCHKTCPHYPCEVVAQGCTKFGGACLDKAGVAPDNAGVDIFFVMTLKAFSCKPTKFAIAKLFIWKNTSQVAALVRGVDLMKK
jgi:hypothetical protein